MEKQKIESVLVVDKIKTEDFIPHRLKSDGEYIWDKVYPGHGCSIEAEGIYKYDAPAQEEAVPRYTSKVSLHLQLPLGHPLTPFINGKLKVTIESAE